MLDARLLLGLRLVRPRRLLLVRRRRCRASAGALRQSAASARRRCLRYRHRRSACLGRGAASVRLRPCCRRGVAAGAAGASAVAGIGGQRRRRGCRLDRRDVGVFGRLGHRSAATGAEAGDRRPQPAPATSSVTAWRRRQRRLGVGFAVCSPPARVAPVVSASSVAVGSASPSGIDDGGVPAAAIARLPRRSAPSRRARSRLRWRRLDRYRRLAILGLPRVGGVRGLVGIVSSGASALASRLAASRPCGAVVGRAGFVRSLRSGAALGDRSARRGSVRSARSVRAGAAPARCRAWSSNASGRPFAGAPGDREPARDARAAGDRIRRDWLARQSPHQARRRAQEVASAGQRGPLTKNL